MRRHAGRPTRNGVDAAADCGCAFAAVVVDVFAVSVDGFAGVDFVPGGAAVEAGFEGELEVCAAAYFQGEGEFGGVSVDAHFVVHGGHRATRVFDDVGEPFDLGDVDDCHYLRLRERDFL